MAGFLYYLILPFFYLLSILPFRLLYLLSDFGFFIIYHLIGYRKEVVWKNLRNSFPEKSDEELQIIRKKFYHNFCDIFLETFKTLTISRKNMLKRCHLTPNAVELFDKLAAENKSIVIVLGHLGNWEWGGNSVSMQIKHKLYVIYHPIENKQFDRLMGYMRQRFGSAIVAMKDTFRTMVTHKNELTATAFISDQSPIPETAYWMTFLNQETGVFMGTEKIAEKLNFPVVFLGITKVKRGYYTMDVELLASPPFDKNSSITAMHTRKLEEHIKREPENWLWTHKRWKRQRPSFRQLN